MTRDDLIEAMARALWDTHGYVHSSEDRIFEPLEYGSEGEYAPTQSLCQDGARSALTALCAAIPGLSEVIDGKAVIVPMEPVAAMVDGGARSLRGAGLGQDCYSAARGAYAAMIETRPK